MNWWQYLLLANVYLVLFYGFYALMLRRETFFQLNRVYMVSSALLSFMIPLIQAQWARNLFITQRINQTIYRLDTVNVYDVQIPLQQNRGITFGQGLAMVYIAGIIFLLGRFLLQLFLLRRNLRSPETEDAYSFFRQIKLSDKLANCGIIMAHEQVHAQQWHSADVLLMEAVMIVNWFNPVVYFYRKAIKHIHEFIADRNALKAGAGKQEYALLLLGETLKTPVNQLVNPFFNHSLLKQRIMMLQKDHSRRIALIKYGFSAPLFALMIILSSATVKTNKVITKLNEKATEVMLMQASPVDNGDATIQIQKPAQPPSLPGIVKKNKNPNFYTSVEQLAGFPGGIDAFGKYLEKNINITPAIKATLPQKAVVVQFIVEKNGMLSGIHTLRGSGPTAAEAMRVIKLSPRWKPGKQNGKAVRQQYNVPINFTMPELGKTGAVKENSDNGQLFTVVEHSAGFPNGMDALIKFIGKNIKVTPEMKAKMPFPKIICQFVVEENGELSGIKVIRGSGVPAADNEALRVLALSPKWKPGKQNGKAVRQQYMIPITFTATGLPQKVGAVNINDEPVLKQGGKSDTTSRKKYFTIAGSKALIPDAIYYVNGVKLDKKLFGNIKPEDIYSISVYKRNAWDSTIRGNVINVETKEYHKN